MPNNELLSELKNEYLGGNPEEKTNDPLFDLKRRYGIPISDAERGMNFEVEDPPMGIRAPGDRGMPAPGEGFPGMYDAPAPEEIDKWNTAKELMPPHQKRSVELILESLDSEDPGRVTAARQMLADLEDEFGDDWEMAQRSVAARKARGEEVTKREEVYFPYGDTTGYARIKKATEKFQKGGEWEGDVSGLIPEENRLRRLSNDIGVLMNKDAPKQNDFDRAWEQVRGVKERIVSNPQFRQLPLEKRNELMGYFQDLSTAIIKTKARPNDRGALNEAWTGVKRWWMGNALSVAGIGMALTGGKVGAETAGGAKSIITEDYAPSRAADDVGSFNWWMSNVGQGTPSLVQSIAGAATASWLGAPAFLGWAGPVGVQVFGQSFESTFAREMQQSGDRTTAMAKGWTKGIADAAVEVASERIGYGKWGKKTAAMLAGAPGNRVLALTRKTALKKARQVGASAMTSWGAESMEEFIASIGQDLTSEITGDSKLIEMLGGGEKGKAAAKDMAREFADNIAATSATALFGGANAVSNLRAGNFNSYMKDADSYLEKVGVTDPQVRELVKSAVDSAALKDAEQFNTTLAQLQDLSSDPSLDDNAREQVSKGWALAAETMQADEIKLTDSEKKNLRDREPELASDAEAETGSEAEPRPVSDAAPAAEIEKASETETGSDAEPEAEPAGEPRLMNDAEVETVYDALDRRRQEDPEGNDFVDVNGQPLYVENITPYGVEFRLEPGGPIGVMTPEMLDDAGMLPGAAQADEAPAAPAEAAPVAQAAEEAPAVPAEEMQVPKEAEPPAEPMEGSGKLFGDEDVAAFASKDIEFVDPESLKIDAKAFQFKGDAAESGEVKGNELAGGWDTQAAGVMLAYERENGDRYIVEGHHRLNHALRNDVADVAVKVLKESDGVTPAMAKAAGAMANILDEKGTQADYATFFRHDSEITYEQAKERGLLGRARAREAWRIGRSSTDDVFSSYKSGRISGAQALGIVDGAGEHEKLQQVGLKQALDRNLSGSRIEGMLRGLQLMKRGKEPEGPQQRGLFEGTIDQESLDQAKKLGDTANRMARDLRERVRTLKTALQKGESLELTPTEAERYGIKNRKSRPEIERALATMQHEAEVFETTWDKDSELYRRVAEEAGLEMEEPALAEAAAQPAPAQPARSEPAAEQPQAQSEEVAAPPPAEPGPVSDAAPASEVESEAAKEPWKMTRGDFYAGQMSAAPDASNLSTVRQAVLDSHKNQVKQALNEGETVPAEVLADYPELQPPSPAAEGEAASPPVSEIESGSEMNEEATTVAPPGRDPERRRLIAEAQRRGLAENREDFVEALDGESPLTVDIEKLRAFVEPDTADLADVEVPSDAEIASAAPAEPGQGAEEILTHTFYHGSRAWQGDAVNLSKLGINTGASSASEGFFMTDNPAIAAFYGLYQGTPWDAEPHEAFSNAAELVRSISDEEWVSRYADSSGWLSEGKTEVIQGLEDAAKWNEEGEDVMMWEHGYEIIEGLSEKMSEEERNWAFLSPQAKFVTTKIDPQNPMFIDMQGRHVTEQKGGKSFTDVLREAKAAGHDAVLMSNARDAGPQSKLTGTVAVVFDESVMTETNQATKREIIGTGTPPMTLDQFAAELENSSPEMAARSVVTTRGRFDNPSTEAQLNWNNLYNTAQGILDEIEAGNKLSSEQITERLGKARAAKVSRKRQSNEGMNRELFPENPNQGELFAPAEGYEAPTAATAEEQLVEYADQYNRSTEYERRAEDVTENDTEALRGLQRIRRSLRRMQARSAGVLGNSPGPSGRVRTLGGGHAQAYETRIEQILKTRGTTSLIGERLMTPEDVFTLTEVARNPHFESSRVLYLDKDGKVLNEEVASARLPGATAFNPYNSIGQWSEHVAETAAIYGAREVMLYHNHPTGNVNPSRPDIAATYAVARQMQNRGVKFRGHVVGNHKKYTMINSEGEYREHRLPDADSPDPLLESPDVENPLLGKSGRNAREVARLARDWMRSTRSVLFSVNPAGRIGAVGEISQTAIENPVNAVAAIRRWARSAGAGQIIMAGVSDKLLDNVQSLETVGAAITEGVVYDVVLEDGTSLRSDLLYRPAKDMPVFGQRVQARQYGFADNLLMRDENGGYSEDMDLGDYINDPTRSERFVAKAQDLFNHWLRVGLQRGGVRRWLGRQQREFVGAKEKAEFLHKKHSKRLYAATQALEKKMQDRAPEAIKAIEAVAKGEMAIEELTDPAYDDIKPQIIRLREEIDSYSETMMDLGIPPEKMRMTFEKNKGRYIVRPYLKFEQRGYEPTTEKKLAAAQVIRGEILENLDTVAQRVNATAERYKSPAFRQRLRTYVATGDQVLLSGQSKTFVETATRLRTMLEAMNEQFANVLDASVGVGRDAPAAGLIVSATGDFEINIPEKQLQQVVKGTLDYILEKDTLPWDVAGGGVGASGTKVDTTSFKKRKDIDPVIREYMGEIHHLAPLYQLTAMRMSRTIESWKFLKQIEDTSNQFPVDHPSKVLYRQPHGRFKVPVPTSAAYGPLALHEIEKVDKDGNVYKSYEGGDPNARSLPGRVKKHKYYTDMATARMLRGIAEPASHSTGFRLYMKGVAMPRFLKTVGNPPTHARNILGNVLFKLADGEHLFRRTWGPAKLKVWKTLMGVARGDEQALEQWGHYMEISAITGSAHAQEIRETYQDAIKEISTVEGMSWKELAEKNPETVLAGLPKIIDRLEKRADKMRPGRMLNRTMKVLTGLYALEDNIPKLTTLEAKRMRYRPRFERRFKKLSEGDRFFGMQEEYTFHGYEDGKVKLTDTDDITKEYTLDEILEREGVARLRSAYPYYDDAPALITDILRRTPFFPDFLTFHAESIRIMPNHYINAYHDIKHWNDPTGAVGAIAAHTTAGTAMAGGISLLGLAAAAVLRMLGKQPPEEEEEQALRTLGPEWQQTNAMLGWKDENRRWQTLDIGYIQPYDMAQSFLQALNAPPGEKFGRFMHGMGNTFVGANIFTQTVGGIIANSDQWGNKIVSDDDGMFTKAGKAAWHVAKEWSPSFMFEVLQAAEVAQADQELLSRDGEVRSVGRHLGKAFTPLRVRERDPLKDFEYKARHIARMMRDRKSTASRTWYDWYEGYETTKSKDQAIRLAQRKLEELAAGKMDKYVEAAFTLGYTWEEVDQTMKQSGVSNQDREYYWDTRRDLGYGAFPYYPPTFDDVD